MSLGHVLKCSESGISLDSLLSMPDYVTEGSAVIAGSTIAQACLGEIWNSDVDVFCTAKSAPATRSIAMMHLTNVLYSLPVAS